jgi:hypothetical protein
MYHPHNRCCHSCLIAAAAAAAIIIIVVAVAVNISKDGEEQGNSVIVRSFAIRHIPNVSPLLLLSMRHCRHWRLCCCITIAIAIAIVVSVALSTPTVS